MVIRLSNSFCNPSFETASALTLQTHPLGGAINIRIRSTGHYNSTFMHVPSFMRQAYSPIVQKLTKARMILVAIVTVPLTRQIILVPV